MKKTDFLTRLHQEGKLLLEEPSEEVKAAYLNKSESYLMSAKILLKNNKLEESVSLAYYSMYYMILALFSKVGIKCENHSAAIILLEKIFDIDNSAISSAKRERVDKQYYVDFIISSLEVEDLIGTAEVFNSKILDFIERLNNERIAEFREKMEKI